MQYTNDQQAVLEKAIENYLAKNKEPVLNRIYAPMGFEILAAAGKDIHLRTSEGGKAYYNDVELVTSSVGGEGNYLWISGGNNIMLQDLSMGGNRSIVSMMTNRNWDYVTADEGLCKSDIIGAGGFMAKAQTPQNSWYFEYGLKLPQGLDASRSATPDEGAVYWATDTDKLYIGKGNDLWQEIGTSAVWGGITGTLGDQTDLQNALDAKLPLTGGMLTGDLTINKDSPRLTIDASTGWGDIIFKRSGSDKAAISLDTSNNLYIRSFESSLALGGGSSIILRTGTPLTTRMLIQDSSIEASTDITINKSTPALVLKHAGTIKGYVQATDSIFNVYPAGVPMALGDALQPINVYCTQLDMNSKKIAGLATATNPSDAVRFDQLGPAFIKPSAYVVYKDGSTYKAVNGTTGSIDYQGSDASIVIQNAIDNLPGGTGYGSSKITLREGRFILTAGLFMSSDIIFEGAGEGTELYAADGSNIDVITCNGINNFHLRDFKINGNRANNTSGRGIFVTAPSSMAVDAEIMNVKIRFCKGNGLETNSTVMGLRVYNMLCDLNGGSGFYIHGSDHMFYACESRNNTEYGWHVIGSTHTFEHVLAAANRKSGVNEQSWRDTWIALDSDLNDEHGIFISGTYNQIIGAQIYRNNWTGGVGTGITVAGNYNQIMGCKVGEAPWNGGDPKHNYNIHVQAGAEHTSIINNTLMADGAVYGNILDEGTDTKILTLDDPDYITFVTNPTVKNSAPNLLLHTTGVGTVDASFIRSDSLKGLLGLDSSDNLILAGKIAGKSLKLQTASEDRIAISDTKVQINRDTDISGYLYTTGNVTIAKTDPAVQFQEASVWRGKLYTTGNDMTALCELGNLYLSTAVGTGGDVILENRGNPILRLYSNLARLYQDVHVYKSDPIISIDNIASGWSHISFKRNGIEKARVSLDDGDNLNINSPSSIALGTNSTTRLTIADALITSAVNIKMTSARSVILTKGDNDTTHVGGVQFLTYDNGVNNVWTPTDQYGSTLDSTIRLGGFGNFNSNTVNLAVSGNLEVRGADKKIYLHNTSTGWTDIVFKRSGTDKAAVSLNPDNDLFVNAGSGVLRFGGAGVISGANIGIATGSATIDLDVNHASNWSGINYKRQGSTKAAINLNDSNMLYINSPSNSLLLDGYNVRVNTGLYPHFDNSYQCGNNIYRWSLVRGVTVTSGDIGFEERECAVCGEDFKVGEVLSLIVVETGDGDAPTRCVPIHNHHKHGDKFKWSKDTNANKRTTEPDNNILESKEV